MIKHKALYNKKSRKLVKLNVPKLTVKPLVIPKVNKFKLGAQRLSELNKNNDNIEYNSINN